MTVDLGQLKFDENGLIPAIIQDAATKKVLMLAYMNNESLQKTIETKRTWFFSRSRQRLWNKGETSGNYQIVQNIHYDCDGDTLLIDVEPMGNACHTGEETCFYRTALTEETSINSDSDSDNILEELYRLIADRKKNPVEGSYTNYLFAKGIDKILKKVGEEASEVIIGSKNANKTELVSEISDLVYHLMVLMVEKEVSIADIKSELQKRHKGE